MSENEATGGELAVDVTKLWNDRHDASEEAKARPKATALQTELEAEKKLAAFGDLAPEALAKLLVKMGAITGAWSQAHREWIRVGKAFHGRDVQEIRAANGRLFVMVDAGNGDMAVYLSLPGDTTLEYLPPVAGAMR